MKKHNDDLTWVFVLLVAIGTYLLCGFIDNLAHAEGVWLSTGGVSVHAASGHNDLNPGLGVEYEIEPQLSFAVGQYRNSFKEKSTYILIHDRVWWAGNLSLKIVGGAVNGYRGINSGSFSPVLLPEISYEGRTAGANLYFIPDSSVSNGMTVGLQFKYHIVR